MVTLVIKYLLFKELPKVKILAFSHAEYSDIYQPELRKIRFTVDLQNSVVHMKKILLERVLEKHICFFVFYKITVLFAKNLEIFNFCTVGHVNIP